MAEPKPVILEIITSVVCDDIRREDTGKDILIGVYSGDILVPRFPANINLAVWLHVRPSKAGEAKFDFRLVGPHDVQFVQGHGEVTFGAVGPGSISLAGLPAPVQVPGELRLLFRQGNEEWRPVAGIQVRERPRQAPK